MFYDAVRNTHGLKHDPFKALVAPRPIGWIGTLAADGTRNLAPYSYFNAVSTNPHIVVFSSEGQKDSVTNIDATGEFSCSLAVFALKDAMNDSSAIVDGAVDEFELAGLTPAPCEMIAAPRVAESPVALECRHLRTIPLEGLNGQSTIARLVLGQVVGVHIDETLISDGVVDITKARPLARLGYRDYCVVDEVFAMARPGM